MKKAIILISIIMVILAMNVCSYASTNASTNEDVRNSKGVEEMKSSPEQIKEIRDKLIEKANKFKNTIELDESTELALIREASLNSDNGLIKYINDNKYELQYDKAYRVFSFSDKKIVTNYKKSKSMKNIIANDHSWRIPLCNKNGLIEQELILKVVNKRVEFISIQENVSDLTSKLIDKQGLKDEVVKNLKTNDVSDFKVVSSGFYKTSFIYFTSDGEEYIVPSKFGKLVTSLNEGKVYKAERAFQELDSEFDESIDTSSSEEGLIGGNEPFRRTSKVNFELYLYIFGSLSVIGLISLFLIKRSSNAKTAILP